MLTRYDTNRAFLIVTHTISMVESPFWLDTGTNIDCSHSVEFNEELYFCTSLDFWN